MYCTHKMPYELHTFYTHSQMMDLILNYHLDLITSRLPYYASNTSNAVIPFLLLK